ncbi:MBOAT family O-acyltransferase [Bradyrhizobium sp. LHD-71]|uniref:MBOAT family O-acyltransferase n=1 Tax=Bradyrhizobium sp. LHD-71 TaxID=3072141 RepID=UPI00280C3F76|nr:MBOAT family O-acyltransferase [Bradyrhizobium sp. LHD-71]MDQ8726426.1 MBOAT family O-acyltransferase [Bradyrhizobium sp. LHD-71]
MLFNSPQFIFGFLPVSLIGFFLLGQFGWYRLAILWLGFVSLVFYGFDNPALQLPLILASITFNFTVGRYLATAKSRNLLIAGVAGNLLLLGFFKYAGLLASTFNAITGLAVPDPHIPLPIGISFYTFTQIAFLVDVYRREAREYEFAKYGLFVTFFPHLIAGPILHHKETVPQFDHPKVFRPQPDRIALGTGWLAIGMFKKVMLADSVAPFADAVFGAAQKGAAIDFADAWIGTLCYTLQIYFDFSGYSDMAIGLALLFGITFPLNFNSPYKAQSLIEFWRCWHMTLSRFLRDYLYVPLGGNRRGALRRYINLFITMVLGGLWHGASWNFAIWGALHGAGLALNHLWRGIAARTGLGIPAGFGWLLTFGVVAFAWVPFRADTLAASTTIWQAMLGLGEPAAALGGNPLLPVIWIVGLGAIALFAPNTQQIMSHPWIDERARISWTPRPVWAIALGCLFGIAVAGTFGRETVFLYFRF